MENQHSRGMGTGRASEVAISSSPAKKINHVADQRWRWKMWLQHIVDKVEWAKNGQKKGRAAVHRWSRDQVINFYSHVVYLSPRHFFYAQNIGHVISSFLHVNQQNILYLCLPLQTSCSRESPSHDFTRSPFLFTSNQLLSGGNKRN